MTDLPDRKPSERERLLDELRQLAGERHETACWLLGWITHNLPSDELGGVVRAGQLWDERDRRRRADLIRERFGGRSGPF